MSPSAAGGARPDLLRLRRLLRRGRVRRWLAAASVALAVLLLTAQHGSPAGSVGGRAVLVAAVDLAAGQVITAGDLRTDSRSPALLPDGTLEDVRAVVGRRTVAAVRAGEVLTDVRVAPSGLLPPGAADGEVAAPVRIADAAAVELVHAGDRIDVLAAGSDGAASATLVAVNATVLAVPTARAEAGGVSGGGLSGGELSGGGLGGGGLVVLQVPLRTAQDLAGAAAAGPLSVVLRS